MGRLKYSLKSRLVTNVKEDGINRPQKIKQS
jgi:hypothetical protein